MQELAKSVEIKIKSNVYTVRFPNNGEYLDIRSISAKLRGNIVALDAFDAYGILLADMIATYKVMIPNLAKDINVDSMLKLSLFESKELMESYVETYKPFFDNWMNILTAPKFKVEETANA